MPQLLVRITEIPEGYGTTGKAREKITQYNNTHNTIKISDFRSNDPIQASLKHQFGDYLGREKRSFIWQNEQIRYRLIARP